MKPWETYETFEERLPNHVFIQRVADAAGVSTQSVHRVAKKRLQKEGKRDRKRLKGCPYTFVSLSLWDEYMEIGPVKRVAAKPKNWLTAKALLEDGFSKRKLYQLVREGSVKAVYVGNTLYLEPESAERYIQTRQDLRPPPGWTSVSELREQAGRSKQALSTYLKRHQVETAQFLHPKRDQLVQYIRVEDAQKYLRCHQGLCATETAQIGDQETALLDSHEMAQNDLTVDAVVATDLRVQEVTETHQDLEPITLPCYAFLSPNLPSPASKLAGPDVEQTNERQPSRQVALEPDTQHPPQISSTAPGCKPLRTDSPEAREEQPEVQFSGVFVAEEPLVSADSRVAQPVGQPSKALIPLEYATSTLHGGIAAPGGIVTSSRLPGHNERETSMLTTHPSFLLPNYLEGQETQPGMLVLSHSQPVRPPLNYRD
jgi:hypothetical protein